MAATRKNKYGARTLIVTGKSGKQIFIKLTTQELGELSGVHGYDVAHNTEQRFLEIARKSMGEDVEHLQIDHRWPG